MSQNIRILVIEDEKNIQNFITSVLNSQHYQVISSLTGRDRAQSGSFRFS